MTDAELGRAWLEFLGQQRRLSPATVANYDRALALLLRLKGTVALRRLDAQAIRRMVAQLHGAGLSGRTLALTLSAWRGLYRWLARHHGFAGNPAQGVRSPKSPRRLPKALSVEDAQRLIEVPEPGTPEAASDRDADFVIAMSNYVPTTNRIVELEECRQVMSGIQIHSVERMNALLSVVIDRRAFKLETASRQPIRRPRRVP